MHMLTNPSRIMSGNDREHGVIAFDVRVERVAIAVARSVVKTRAVGLPDFNSRTRKFGPFCAVHGSREMKWYARIAGSVQHGAMRREPAVEGAEHGCRIGLACAPGQGARNGSQ